MQQTHGVQRQLPGTTSLRLWEPVPSARAEQQAGLIPFRLPGQRTRQVPAMRGHEDKDDGEVLLMHGHRADQASSCENRPAGQQGAEVERVARRPPGATTAT